MIFLLSMISKEEEHLFSLISNNLDAQYTWGTTKQRIMTVQNWDATIIDEESDNMIEEQEFYSYTKKFKYL